MPGSEWCFDLEGWEPSVGEWVLTETGARFLVTDGDEKWHAVEGTHGLIAYWRPPAPPDPISCAHGLHDLTSTVEDKDGNEFAACSQCEFVATEGVER